MLQQVVQQSIEILVGASALVIHSCFGAAFILDMDLNSLYAGFIVTI